MLLPCFVCSILCASREALIHISMSIYQQLRPAKYYAFKCCKSGSVWRNYQHLSWGVYGVYSSIKIALKRYTDMLQIQIKYNKMHSHSTLPTRSFIHSITHSFIHSFIHITPLMHHPCITHSSHTASYYASPIHHTASQRIIPVKHYIQQITLTHNALDASQCWCIITTMHHSDDASQQCITTLMHYGTTS